LSTELVKAAHRKFSKLSITTQIVMLEQDSEMVTVIAQVVTERGEYSYWSTMQIGALTLNTSSVKHVLDDAIDECLRTAGVDVDYAHQIEAPKEEVEAEPTGIQWDAVDESPESYGYTKCEGDGEPHAIKSYFSGTAEISSAQVEALSVERFGKKLCAQCAIKASSEAKRKKK